ncbi:MAG: hypothetical protein K2K70_10305 [Lachnospiraceae bacterium]|nr:hypothetical protein [Lachnospiraceae bacterium]
MKKNTKGLQYQLEKERELLRFYVGFVMTTLNLIFGVILCIENKEFSSDMYIDIGIWLIPVVYLLYANYSKIKKKILFRHGVKHKAEIVKACYGAPGRDRVPSYYLVIDFINSKGKKKTLYTPGYHGNPNMYLKSANCSVYEWKGFYVEGDFQMRDEIDYFGYAGIPTEKKEFIWR